MDITVSKKPDLNVVFKLFDIQIVLYAQKTGKKC